MLGRPDVGERSAVRRLRDVERLVSRGSHGAGIHRVVEEPAEVVARISVSEVKNFERTREETRMHEAHFPRSGYELPLAAKESLGAMMIDGPPLSHVPTGNPTFAFSSSTCSSVSHTVCFDRTSPASCASLRGSGRESRHTARTPSRPSADPWDPGTSRYRVAVAALAAPSCRR